MNQKTTIFTNRTHALRGQLSERDSLRALELLENQLAPNKKLQAAARVLTTIAVPAPTEGRRGKSPQHPPTWDG